MSKEMLINTVEGQECRIAIVESGVLQELYVERQSNVSKVGNIYKGRVTNVEPSIQAAFIEFGGERHGFLHISDVHPQHFPKGIKGAEAVGRKRGHRERPPIQECLKRGDEVTVQLTKEGIGTKGPTLSTYLSLPGRMLVMMPGMSRLGVSRKIEDDEARESIRHMLADMDLPKDTGFIVRTAGVGRPKRELQRDLNYLERLWKLISQRIKTDKPPVEIYKESDLVIRTVRDIYNSEIKRIVCDNIAVAMRVREFLAMAMPRTRHAIEVYTGQNGLFQDYGVEAQIEDIYAQRVELKSGGSLVIDQTEALVAIDVNSGRFRQHSDAEKSALAINVEAVQEIARQLRLRDLGGVIIIDTIDMRDDKNRREVEKTLRAAIKPDRAKTKILKISQLGLIEMTRQRVRPSLKASVYQVCPNCSGAGLLKSEETLALSVMRDLHRASHNPDAVRIDVSVSPVVAEHLNNTQRAGIHQLEQQSGKTIRILADASLVSNEVQIHCRNNRNSQVAWKINHHAGDQPKIQTLPLDEALRAPSADMAPIKTQTPAGETPMQDEAAQPKPKRKRSRRGGRKHRRSNAPKVDAERAEAQHGEPAKVDAERAEAQHGEPAKIDAEQAPPQPTEPARQVQPDKPAKPAETEAKDSSQPTEESYDAPRPKRKRRSRRRRKSVQAETTE